METIKLIIGLLFIAIVIPAILLKLSGKQVFEYSIDDCLIDSSAGFVTGENMTDC